MIHKKNVLTIAGSDSSGGAGIQADLKTFEALGVYGASVITSITAQNTLGVQSIYDLPVHIVESQLTSVLSDIEFSAIKLGMLKTAEQIIAIANVLADYAAEFIVLDTVMISSSGYRLQEESASKQMIHSLFPLSDLITPNIPEAAALINKSESWVSKHLGETCSLLMTRYPLKAVLLKGGHAQENICTDTLAIRQPGSAELLFKTYSHPKIPTKNTHGTGCTLASAIAAYIAQDNDLITAIELAGSYLQTALKSSDQLRVGTGFGPLNHHSVND